MAGNQRKGSASKLPEEYAGVSQDQVDLMLEKLNKCYSKEDYEVFQEAVRKIVLETLGNDDGRKKIKNTATIAAKEWHEQNAWKQKTFWIPVVINALICIATIAVVLVT